MDFNQLKRISNEMGERNDCSVKAVALATGADYSDVHALFAACGRRKGCESLISWTLAVLKELGAEIENVTSRVRAKGGLTVLTAERVLRHTKGAYVIFTASHCLTIRDGIVEDWSNGRRLRVGQVWFVSMEGAPKPNFVEVLEKPKLEFTMPREGTNRQIIHAVAFRFWEDAGCPMEQKVIRKLRIRMMDALEEYGIKRTSASCELGVWEKEILAK